MISKLFVSLVFSCVLLTQGFAKQEEGEEREDDHKYGDALSSSCIGKEDGDYWLQLSVAESDYPPVKLTCSNEYVILDINKDSNLANYFTSYEKWHYKLAGPANHDPVSWKEWFIPSNDNNNENSQYLLSPDCNVCDSNSEYQVHEESTTYWMTGNLAKLHWGVIGFNECDMDWETYQCYDCQNCLSMSAGCEPVAYTPTSTDFKTSGICGVTVQESNHYVYKSREMAQQSAMVNNYKPSIGTGGEFCVCYKPGSAVADAAKESHYLTDWQEEIIEQRKDEEEKEGAAKEKEAPETQEQKQKTLKTETQNEKQISEQSNEAAEEEETEIETEEDEEEEEDARGTNIVYLSQVDFAEGTYRIQESGTYVITEDIEFDFGRENDYWPIEEQGDMYPGAASYRDAYHLGFFAGITIESDYVTINLNGYKLSQTVEFYYQQRWFAIIELGNQQFLPGQGPAFFGPSPVILNNIEIKNGVLGRSSHFGIHGNFPTNLSIKNVKIRDFVTHGIQLNGWENLVIENIEIGPSSDIEYLRGDYGHGRILLQRLRKIEDQLIEDGTINDDDKLLSFDNFDENKKYKTIGDIADEMEEQMSLALEYALNKVENKYEDNDWINPDHLQTDDELKTWEKTKSQFIHESGIPASSSISGMFLNFDGASVFSYAKYTTHKSKNGLLNNIYIHDIQHDMIESMRFSYRYDTVGGQVYPTPWNSDIPAEHAFGSQENLEALQALLYKYDSDDEEYEMYDAEYTMEIIKNTPEFRYQGGIITDAYFAMATVSDDWDLLGFLQMREVGLGKTDVQEWVNGDINEGMLDWIFGCNQDIMGHSGKGLIGLRIDGVDNVQLANIRIENLHEHTPLGTSAGGEYWDYNTDVGGGHFKQLMPMQYGFSGNDLQGLSIVSSSNVEFYENIFINNLNNDYAQAFGLSMWTANDIYFNRISNKQFSEAFVKVTNIKSGIKLLDDDELYAKAMVMPNRSPEACGIRMEVDNHTSVYWSKIHVKNNGMNNMVACNIYGPQMCWGSDGFPAKYNLELETGNSNSGQGLTTVAKIHEMRNAYTMYGIYSESVDVCEEVKNYADLQELMMDEMKAQGYLVDVNDNNSDDGDDDDSDDDEEETEASVENLKMHGVLSREALESIEFVVFGIVILVIGACLIARCKLAWCEKNMNDDDGNGIDENGEERSEPTEATVITNIQSDGKFVRFYGSMITE